MIEMIMIMNKFSKKAQITSEYAILVTIIVVALFAMQFYIKRGFSARLKDAIDYPLRKPEANFSTSQYEPNYYFSSSLTDTSSEKDVSMTTGSAIDSSTEMTSSLKMWEKINGTH
jgi:ubiquitin-protein ligase